MKNQQKFLDILLHTGEMVNLYDYPPQYITIAHYQPDEILCTREDTKVIWWDPTEDWSVDLFVQYAYAETYYIFSSPKTELPIDYNKVRSELMIKIHKDREFNLLSYPEQILTGFWNGTFWSRFHWQPINPNSVAMIQKLTRYPQIEFSKPFPGYANYYMSNQVFVARKATTVTTNSSLLETSVVGGYYQNKWAVNNTRIYEAVILRREPANPYDNNAIRVEKLNGQYIGYIGRWLAKSLIRGFDKDRGSLEGIIISRNQSWKGLEVQFQLPFDQSEFSPFISF